MSLQFSLGNTSLPDSWEYSLCNTPVKIICQEPGQAGKLAELLERIFAFNRQRELVPAPGVTLHFGGLKPVLETGGGSKEVYSSRDLKICTTSRGYFFQKGSSVLDLDLLTLQGIGVLENDFWRYSFLDQREFFLFALIILMRPLGLYGLHANGVAKEGVGYLVVGDSGCGKTTLSLNLVLQGWNYLSDDVLMLRMEGVKVAALALRQGFSCPEDSFARMSLSKIFKHEISALSGYKRMIDNTNLFPEKFINRFLPSVLLFPGIANQPQTRLVAMNPTNALLALIRQSSGLLIDAASTRKQMEVLKILADQTHSYQILLGTDVYECPALVSNLIWETRPDGCS